MTENPFHVLGLPVTASKEQVARQYERLAKRAGQAAQEQARLRCAWENLRTNQLQRSMHELLEMPDTAYREREDEWRGLALENQKNPVDVADLAAQAPDLSSIGIDLRAVLELLASSLAGPREAILRDSVVQPPDLPGAGVPPLRAADVIIGGQPPAGPAAQTSNETAHEKGGSTT